MAVVDFVNLCNILCGVRVTQSLVLCVMFCRSLFVLLSIVLSVLHWFMDSDDPFGIFKFFLNSDGKIFHQYQQNEQLPVSSNNWT